MTPRATPRRKYLRRSPVALRVGACAAAAICAIASSACGTKAAPQVEAPRAAVPEAPARCGFGVFFSIANEDQLVREAEIKVLVDGQPLAYGTHRAPRPGEPAEYHYVATRVPQKKIVVRATSPSDDGGIVEEENSAVVTEGTWIVVTRVRDVDGKAALRIEFSYEGPMAAWGEDR
jgi:hypothetical protein